MIKGKIIHIGTFDKNGQPVGWSFDFSGLTIGPCLDVSEITPGASDPEIYYAGYTVAELKEIANNKT